MSKKLTILVYAIEGVGHVNACIGLAEALHSRGHHIVFTVGQSFRGQLVSYGFEEEILEKEEIVDTNAVKDFSQKLLKSKFLSSLSSYEKLKIMVKGSMFPALIDEAIAIEPKFKAIVDKHNPDIILMDTNIASPAFIYSGKPWVSICSANPLYYMYDERTPPPCSGLPTNVDKSEWKAFTDISDNFSVNRKEKYYKWLKENGFENPDNKTGFSESPFLNIYGFPEELDYTDIRPNPKNWLRVDSFMRKSGEELKLPEQLSKRDGKLIYLSLGSMGSIDVELMKRLVKILSKSKHQFIVSKGLLADKYELADNMWGQRSVPQTKVLPLVDLVITHGGNNTVTETFSFGKPMIVLPLMWDQYDNAQRVHEKGFGIRLDPYLCSEEELLNGIESLLNDNELTERLSMASKRILSSNSLLKASEMIESLVK